VRKEEEAAAELASRKGKKGKKGKKGQNKGKKQDAKSDDDVV
jgi:hypothetical protein